MKKLVRFAVLVSFVAVFSQPLLAKTMSTCLDYSPFYFNDDGQKVWSGNNIETLSLVAKEMGLTLDTSTRAPFVRCVKLLENSKVDILSGLIHTKHRAKKFLLVPYSTKERLAIFYLKSRNAPFDLQESASKRLIGMHRAFALPDELKESPLFEQLVPIRTVGTGLDMVVKNRIDGVLAAVATGTQILKEESDYGAIFDFQLLPYYGDQYVYFAVAKSSPLASRLDELKGVLKEMAKDKSLAHLQIISP